MLIFLANRIVDFVFLPPFCFPIINIKNSNNN